VEEMDSVLEPKNRSNSRRGAKIQSREQAEDRCDRARLQSSVLGFLGEKDASVSPQAVRKLEAELKDAGKGFEFHIYKDVKRGFFNDTRREVYHEATATDSWNGMVKFFRGALQTPSLP
jgi:dienelactone hydrolase